MKRTLLGLLALAPLALPACGDEHHHHYHDAPDAGAQPDAGADEPDATPEPALTSSRGRLGVASADPASPEMWVIDLDDGAVVYHDVMLAPAALYASSPTSPYLHANQRLANVVDLIHAGITVQDDASERRVAKATPALLPVFFDGLRPTHWVEHDGWVVVFNDGDGTFDYLHEPSIDSPRLVMRRADTDGAHHGVAVVSHNHILASLSMPAPVAGNPDRRRAWGVTLRTLDTPGVIIDEHDDCEGLHGEAGNHAVVAFGCVDGVLLAEWHGGTFSFRKLLHPETLPAGRVGTLRAHDDLGTLIGNWGSDGFVVIDHAAEPATWTHVDVGALRRNFLLTRDGATLLVLAGDGKLHRFDPVSGAAKGDALEVTATFDSNAGAPQIVVGADHAFILDPRDGTVTEVDLEAWETGRSFDLGGTPSSGAVFGVVP